MVHIIFGPAMAIMSRLRFALKLGVMGALFIAPLSGLVYYVYGKLSADIQFAETERAGVREILAGRDLAKALQVHRGASQIALGDAAAREKLAGMTSAVDARLAAWAPLLTDLPSGQPAPCQTSRSSGSASKKRTSI